MNWLDFVIIIFVLLSGIGGAKNGLVRSVLGLAGLVVGILLAGRFYHALSEKLSFISQTQVAQGVAFALILVACVIVTNILSSILQHLARWAMLGWLDGLGGFVFGVVTGALFSAAVLTLLVKFNLVDLGPTLKGSDLATGLMNSFPVLLGLLPSEFDSVRSFFR